jgi:ABC-2 type transport system ATP-binding protein
VVEVHDLVKRFGTLAAVDRVSFTIRAGEIFGILGPNGSGKTTTIRMLCGLLHADAGEGTCLGFDFRTQSEQIKRQVGYMTQKFSFWEDLSIRENLDFVARVYELPNPRDAAAAAIDRLGLAARQDQLAGTLSGGWKQRLALAACMLHAPKLLLLDEPTAGVDPKARRDFWDEIHRLSGEGLTVLVSTHYMDEAERCDRIVYINLGSIVARGTVAEVVARSGLFTFIVEGEGARALAGELEGSPGVEFVAFFGTALHVSGRDRAALTKAMERLKGRPGLEIHEAPPSLEDVFIQLQDKNGDDPS